MTSRRSSLTPSAARLTTSLRDVGYDFPAAVADLVDNSVSAGARRVDVEIEFDGGDSRVFIADDGCGMTTNGVLEALRFGSRRAYDDGDLGRYGLGLKTASLSQGRRLTVVSRRNTMPQRISARTLDLDLILELDDWIVIDPGPTPEVQRARGMLADAGGTVVVWENLDRVLPEKSPEGGWARRRLSSLTTKTSEHLSMVFHRFLAGEIGASEPLVITVNGEKLAAWDPFALAESATQELPRRAFEINVGEHHGRVTLQRYVLPSRDSFSSAGEFERHSGPMKWNRQQGLYIYRENRLVQWGGWAGIRGIDEHTKLGRAALDFSSDLDAMFQVNVAKMRVTLPSQLRPMLERPLTELCLRADDAYRKTSKRSLGGTKVVRSEPSADRHNYGLALRSAAAKSGEYAAFKRILVVLRETSPEVVTDLGLE